MERPFSGAEVHPAPSDNAIAARLEAVERDNRRLRRLGLMMIVGVGVLLGLTSAIMVVASRHGMPGMVPQVAEAKKFLLRDRDGRIRGAWGTNEDGAAQLLLQDNAGRARLRFTVLEDGSSGLAFVDSVNNARIVVGILPDESANIVLAEPGGKTRAVLGVAPNGSTTLVFADRGGATKAGIGVDTRGLGTLNVVGRPGTQVEELPEEAE
ncbi:MAG: hypothetical protein H0V12_05840, partial [Chloroflexi bacterium]|nr:hypothetical protein [Chloroflexota bacterium]